MNALHQRLFKLSARALSDGELLEVLLDSNALAHEPLSAVGKIPPEDWLEDSRLSAERAARLLVALELGRRSLLPRNPPRKIRSPFDAFEFIRPHLTHLAHEEMHVLCLSASNVLLRHRCVARGSATRCDVDPREVFFPALACRAAGVLLVHNHPSGDPQPSTHDVELTQQLCAAGRSLCVRVADHLVVADDQWISMLAQGLLTGPASLSQATERT